MVVLWSVSPVWAETVELVTYFPSGGAGGTDPQFNSLRVGSGYQGTATPANGIALIETALGIGTAGAPNEQLEITENFRLPPTTATTGIIRSGDNLLIHSFGENNFFAGSQAGNLTMAGIQNTGVGVLTLATNTTGTSNSAFGGNALTSNTTGFRNTATGGNSLLANTTGSSNTANGFAALRSNTTGTNNTAIGNAALTTNATGDNNTATGFEALVLNTSAGNNTAIGFQALRFNTTGANNTAVGYLAGGLGLNATGTGNTFIGYQTRPGADNLTNATAIGANALVSASNAIVLGGTGANAVNVGIGTATPTTVVSPANNQATGNLDVNDVFLRSTGQWVSQRGGGPIFINPVMVYNSRLAANWTTFDASAVIPAGASAVILDFEGVLSVPQSSDTYVRIRRDNASPSYILARVYMNDHRLGWGGQGVFPITAARTFQFQVWPQGFDGPNAVAAVLGCKIRIIGYYN